MSRHVLNEGSNEFVWNEIWRSDRYAASTERHQRAIKRLNAFRVCELLSPDKILLDIGCGSGETLKILAAERQNLFGVDRSIQALNLAQTRSSSGSIRYSCADALSIPFDSNRFDLVCLFGVLEHCRDPNAVLAELERIMKPGGIAFISSSNSASLLQIRNQFLAAIGQYPYGYQRNWTLESLCEKLRQRFVIRQRFILQSDEDMPIVARFDRLVSCFVNHWGRYLCVAVSKRDSV